MSISEVSAEQPNERLVVLLTRAREGSNSSLGELLIAYRDYLLAIADEELGSDLKVKVSASDVIQDSFLEAKRDFCHFAGKTPSEFQWWLRRVLLNNVANVNRNYRETAKRDVSREVPVALIDRLDRDRALVAGDSMASSIVEKNELLDRVQAAVQRLQIRLIASLLWTDGPAKSYVNCRALATLLTVWCFIRPRKPWRLESAIRKQL